MEVRFWVPRDTGRSQQLTKQGAAAAPRSSRLQVRELYEIDEATSSAIAFPCVELSVVGRLDAFI